MREKIRKHFPILPFVLSLFWELLRLLKVAPHAPLRKVVTRRISVHSYYLNSDRPWNFTVYATLDCGHEYREFEWSFLDLVYAYTETPEVNARRHRCHPCRDLALAKKPVRSVGLEGAEVAA